MRRFTSLAFGGLFATGAIAASIKLNVSATTSGSIESVWTTSYYSHSKPLLITNDGGASTGGFHAFNIDGKSPLDAFVDRFEGRTKLVATVYDIAGKDYLVSIPQTTSIFSFYELPGVGKIDDVALNARGDWSALCPWKSHSGNTYLFLFGKQEGVQYLVRSEDDAVQMVEVQTFEVPMEFAGCAASETGSTMYLTPDDGTKIYSFDLKESTKAPKISVFGEVEDSLTGISIYRAKGRDYFFAAQSNIISVFGDPWNDVGTLEVTGMENIEVQGLQVHQAKTLRYPQGLLAYAVEADDFQGFGLSSLEGALSELGIEPNTAYDPRSGKPCGKNPISEKCHYSGFSKRSSRKCDCFAGTTGDQCQNITCADNCNGRGTCVGPNTCKCADGWGGASCSYLLVEPTYETEANGPDGDDPAIWISPKAPELSRIVTTTKSDDGAGFGVFDLTGKQLQIFPLNQPNNVDIIYGFEVGNRTVDLAYAACRGDNTLCIVEITKDGRLKSIPGGIQPSDVEDELYGSCVYRSRKSGKQYLFVNEKSARYMQYELTANKNGTLQTILVREFVGGSGGQVEGCVTDEDNGWLILGEEPSALWRYDAEPDGDEEGYRMAYVGDGHLEGDVEGVTLVQGPTKDEGFIFVSCQGISAYNIYRRAHPHEWVATFTITESSEGNIDGVTNTDGLAAVGVNLGPEFPNGLLVVHDDTNELPQGGADEFASYKLVALDYILGAPALKELGLMDEVDSEWDPRAQRDK